MNKPLLIFTLVFSTMMFSSPSYGEWTKVDTSVDGDTFYVDFERIRKHGGYIYWWDLSDWLKPLKSESLSAKMHKQGDCKLFRYKVLSFTSHKEPHGGGIGDVQEPVERHKGWPYPPTSVAEKILKLVCSPLIKASQRSESLAKL